MSEEKDKNKESDFDLFNLGGLFKSIEKLVDLAGELKETEIHKEGSIDLEHLKKGMKGVYGFTVKSAVGGGSRVETFGNIKKTPQGPKVEEEREPITDLFNEPGEMVIIAEMPGVAKDDISVELKADILEISASGKNRNYRKELLLPVKGNGQNLSLSYNNGILEIRIKK